MAYPRVVPHSDGAGVVDAVGAGVDRARVGSRVWVYGAQSYRPHGTAAQLTVVPSELAVDLPPEVGDDLGACLGIPGVTAHRAVFGDGDVRDTVVLVQGVLGGTDPAAALRAHAPDGVARVVVVSLSDNPDLDAAVVADGAVVAAYATRADRPSLPLWPLLFANVTLRLLGSDDFPATAKQPAARDLTEAARVGALSVPVGRHHDLADVAAAHDEVDAGGRSGRVLVTIPD